MWNFGKNGMNGVTEKYISNQILFPMPSFMLKLINRKWSHIPIKRA